MKENKVITHLNLNGMFVIIFIFLKCCFHLCLTYLSFHDFFFFLINSIVVANNIGDDGAKCISEGMKENTVITFLYLGGMFVFI